MKSKYLLVVMVVTLLLSMTFINAQDDTIILIENNWSASSLNVNVAKIILEAELDYEVEIVALDESAQWAAIAAGEADASLEVWPSGHADNVAQYIDELEVVENAGELGVVGKIGWFVPTYVIDEHPELAVEHARGQRDVRRLPGRLSDWARARASGRRHCGSRRPCAGDFGRSWASVRMVVCPRPCLGVDATTS